MILLELIETSIFTRQVEAAMPEEEFQLLQWFLLLHPEAGALIRGSGGLRKLRWALPGRGKRSGARIIYYVKSSLGQLFLLFLYPKNVQADLSAKQLRRLAEMVGEI